MTLRCVVLLLGLLLVIACASHPVVAQSTGDFDSSTASDNLLMGSSSSSSGGAGGSTGHGVIASSTGPDLVNSTGLYYPDYTRTGANQGLLVAGVLIGSMVVGMLLATTIVGYTFATEPRASLASGSSSGGLDAAAIRLQIKNGTRSASASRAPSREPAAAVTSGKKKTHGHDTRSMTPSKYGSGSRSRRPSATNDEIEQMMDM